MKPLYCFFLALALLFTALPAQAQSKAFNKNDFALKQVTVTHQEDLGVTIWEIQVKGMAGRTTPAPVGKLNGAPVLGYVFPTSLKTSDVGFGTVQGIVALALTSHPDFDDTPLWDENNDLQFDNDGMVWHPHWVVLREDKRVEGGFSVLQFDPQSDKVTLPPTNPGMPMYMDSPGFPVTTSGDVIRVVVPDYRISKQVDFQYDAVTCFMKVNTEDKTLPLLGVYEVYGIASGDLSLPYTVRSTASGD